MVLLQPASVVPWSHYDSLNWDFVKKQDELYESLFVTIAIWRQNTEFEVRKRHLHHVVFEILRLLFVLHDFKLIGLTPGWIESCARSQSIWQNTVGGNVCQTLELVTQT